MNKRLVRVTKIVIVNLVVLIVLLETTSVIAYFIKTKEFFYTRSRGRVAATATTLEPPTGDWSPIFALHPYFGYVTQESYVENFARQYGFTTHDHEFLTPQVLPFKKTGNQFVIGLFGGSVAHQVNVYELQHRVLAEALHRLPDLSDKEIVVLNFSQGAYKQPQQLLVLSYFLSVGQQFDMVINIDGFNEVALGYANHKSGVDSAMPASFVFGPLVDLANKDFSSQQLPQMLQLALTRNKLRDALNGLNNCTFATSYVMRRAYASYLNREYQAQIQELAKSSSAGRHDSLIQLNRVSKPLNDNEALDQIVEQWANSSMAMNDLLSARKIPYLEFIQPNQYHASGRHFTEQEMKAAIDQSSPTHEAISRGYPELLSRAEKLRASGVNVLSAANVLDQIKETVYIDNCCHINERGLDVLTKFISHNVVTLLEGQTRLIGPRSGTDR